jgi:diacylglycerol kinase family enzyme
MRHFFVINPHSFRTLAGLKRILMDVENCFTVERRMEYKIYISRRPRDAVAAVYRYLNAAPKSETVRIYAVGGDGILFDCLNGMAMFDNAELTSVPYGSANDFVRTFGEDAMSAFRNISNLSTAPAQAVDIIRCGANYAMIEVNIGFVGKTVITANNFMRGNIPPWVRSFTPYIYTLSGVRTINENEVLRQKYTVDMDGEDFSGNYCNIHIANVPCDGGAFVPSPYAKPDDGELDVIYIESRPKFDIIKAIGARNKGHFEKYDFFTYRKCRKMHVESDAPLCVAMDGEALYAREVSLEIIPKGIKFFAPEGMAFADYSHRAYKRKGGKK